MSGPEGLGPRSLEQAVEEARNIANAAKKTAEEALSLAHEAVAEAKAARSHANEWSRWDGLSVRRHIENVQRDASKHEKLVSELGEELEALEDEVTYIKSMIE